MTDLQIEKLRDIAQGLNTETRMLIMGVCFERDKLADELDDLKSALNTATNDRKAITRAAAGFGGRRRCCAGLSGRPFG